MAENPPEKPQPERKGIVGRGPSEERNGLEHEAAPPVEPPRRTYPPRPKR